MKSYTEQGNYEMAGNYAQKVLDNSKVNSDLKRDAIFTLGRADIAAEKYSSAAGHFTKVIDQLNGEDKMLARYYISYELNQKGAFEDSNTQIKSLIKESASNPYWGAKGLLIMSKNFDALNDQFQASYILESLIKNYPQYKDLTQEASQLLKTLKVTQNEE
jgi:tetratricopeptide (TPR) repeat protein